MRNDREVLREKGEKYVKFERVVANQGTTDYAPLTDFDGSFMARACKLFRGLCAHFCKMRVADWIFRSGVGGGLQ